MKRKNVFGTFNRKISWGYWFFPPLGTSEQNRSVWKETKLVSFLIDTMLLPDKATIFSHPGNSFVNFSKVGAYGATLQGLKSPISAVFKVQMSLFFSAQFFIDYLTLPIIDASYNTMTIVLSGIVVVHYIRVICFWSYQYVTDALAALALRVWESRFTSLFQLCWKYLSASFKSPIQAL